jgi:hypothetical protein
LSYGIFSDATNKPKFREGIPKDIPFNPQKVTRWQGVKHAIKSVLPGLGSVANMLYPGSGAIANAISGLMNEKKTVYIRREFLVK